MATERTLKRQLILERLFCPLQRTFVDVPVYIWRYSKGLGEYLRIMDVLDRRGIDLSPFLVAAAKGIKIPVTPIENPKTGFSSYFIIRMIDDEDETFKVDCLIRDTDLYFMGIRRWMIKQGWSRWYRFREDDMNLPAMFDAIVMPSITSGYEGCMYVRPGGIEAMRTMFKAFAQYPDGIVQDTRMQIACYRFMATIPESRRQLSLKQELIKRISQGKPPSPLTEQLYHAMHCWGQRGNFVLQSRLNNLLLSHRRLPSKTWSHPNFDLVQMRDLIGEKGELLIIHHNRRLMGIPRSEIIQMEQKAKEEDAISARRR
ncbi:hypothetical protein PVAP13_2KG519300 [Panicum virgatum]|uniref:Uncharacterized protein n=1 Tax=Panicum virgatum TaxID=38727 RepID=A0A8T0WD62_PANVG|nr:hypothetical protein PVAP13_2KG519300 [Panicum virgatum]